MKPILHDDKTEIYRISRKRLAVQKYIYIYMSYLLTPWCRILFEKLIVTQLSKNILLSYGTRRFNTAFTKARHWTLFWASRILFAPSKPISLRSILILSSHLRLGLPSNCLGRAKESVQVRGALKHFVRIQNFYAEGLSAPCPTPKVEDHPLPAVRDCLFRIFAATLRTRRTSLHPQTEDAPCRADKGPTWRT
jgi:hypothetical protein